MVTKKKIKSWTVSGDFDSCRIDYWLKKNISFVTYPTLCKLLRKGTVRVNGRRAKNNTVLRIGDKINFTRIIEQEASLDRKAKYNLKFEEFIKKLVVYKDKFKILLNKPAGLAVQGGTNIKLNVDIMLDSLKFNLDERPKLVHRIDKQTSGLLMIARSLNSSRYYGELFRKRKIEKVYLAVVHGNLKYRVGKIGFKIGQEKSLSSLTLYKVLDQNNELSFLVIKPQSGSFQIHMFLPFIAAFSYSIYQLLTRFLGNSESPKTALFSFIASFTYLSPTSVLYKVPPIFSQAFSKPSS